MLVLVLLLVLLLVLKLAGAHSYKQSKVQLMTQRSIDAVVMERVYERATRYTPSSATSSSLAVRWRVALGPAASVGVGR